MAGSLLAAMAALGTAGSGGSSEGPKRDEGAAKRPDAPLPATPCGVTYVMNEDTRKTRNSCCGNGQALARTGAGA